MSSLESITLLLHEPQSYRDNRPATQRFVPEVSLQVIGGVAVAGENPVTQYGLTPDANLSEKELAVPVGMANRIRDFYQARYTQALELQDGVHDCHSFATFVIGAEKHLVTGQPRASWYAPQNPVFPNALEPGQHYAIVDSLPTRGKTPTPKHSLIGTDQPGYSLNVFGQGGELILANTEDLLDYYRGEYIVPLVSHPRQAEPLRLSHEDYYK